MARKKIYRKAYKRRTEFPAKVYQHICDNPGLTVYELAQELGVNDSRIGMALTSMQAQQLLVCEDHRGRLFPHVDEDDNDLQIS